MLLTPDDDLVPAEPPSVAAREGPEQGSDTETLVRFAPTLRVGGTISLSARTSILMNPNRAM